MPQMSLVVTFVVPDDCTPADLQEIVRWELDHSPENTLTADDVYDVSAVQFITAHTPVIDQEGWLTR